jgi:hypothetical protein
VPGKQFSGEWSSLNHRDSYQFSSTAIQEALDRTVEDNNTAAVFFYFDFSDPKKQTTTGMLSSVAHQLLTKATSTPTTLLALYHKHRKENTRPSLTDLSELVVALCNQFRSVYIFLDALDECRERKVLLAALRDMIATKAASFMLTSRAEHDIIEELASTSILKVSIDSVAASKDVRLFVTKRIESDTYLCHLGQNLKDEITTSLVKGANGM